MLEGDRRVRIRRRSGDGLPVRRAGAPAQGGAKITSTPAMAAADTAGFVPIESPMVGTFYPAPAPGAEPYVKEGDTIQKGTVVCIVEAMKLMNEIESEVAGRIARVVAEHGKPVGFGDSQGPPDARAARARGHRRHHVQVAAHGRKVARVGTRSRSPISISPRPASITALRSSRVTRPNT